MAWYARADGVEGKSMMFGAFVCAVFVGMVVAVVLQGMLIVWALRDAHETDG